MTTVLQILHGFCIWATEESSLSQQLRSVLRQTAKREEIVVSGACLSWMPRPVCAKHRTVSCKKQRAERQSSCCCSLRTRAGRIAIAMRSFILCPND